jgi:hypothetical protein
MVFVVLVPPATTTGPKGWLALASTTAPRALPLRHLELMPGIATRAETGPTPAAPRIWDVLAAWRAAERSLAGTSVDSPDWPRMRADLIGLRAAYHRLFHERLGPTNPVLKVAGTTLIVWR